MVQNRIRRVVCTAGRTGGAVLTSGITSVNRSVFSGNQAYVGPAISNTVSLSVGWTEFDGNTLLCDDGHFLDWANVSDCKISDQEKGDRFLCVTCLAKKYTSISPYLLLVRGGAGGGGRERVFFGIC